MSTALAATPKPRRPRRTKAQQSKDRAENLLSPETSASLLFLHLHKPERLGMNPHDISDHLAKVAEAVSQRDLSHPEKLSLGQAVAMDALSSWLIMQASGLKPTDPNFEKLMKLALNAQGRSSKALEVIATLKNPAVFTKQLNVANQQVVANGALPKPPQTEPEALPDPRTKVRSDHFEISTPAHEETRLQA